MDRKALHQITYGLYVVTALAGPHRGGQIANTVFQISNAPATLAVSINKQNYTHQLIANSGAFAVSVLAQSFPLSLIGLFGFQSGRTIDKLAATTHELTAGGIPYLPDNTCAYVEVQVLQATDAGTHTVFIGQVTDANVLSQLSPMTYAMYHSIKRGATPASAPLPPATDSTTPGRFVCDVCGYVYDPAVGDPEHGILPGTPFPDVPDDWVCPVCGAGKDQFSLLAN